MGVEYDYRTGMWVVTRYERGKTIVLAELYEHEAIQLMKELQKELADAADSD